MNRARAVELLAAGGLNPTDVALDSWRPARYNGRADPRGAGELCNALAALLQARNPNRVLVWEPLEDMLLGFMVGREMDCPVTRIVESEGLLHVVGNLNQGDRVAVVADAFRSQEELNALLQVAKNNQAVVVGLAALVDTPALRGAAEQPIWLVEAPTSDPASRSNPEPEVQ